MKVLQHIVYFTLKEMDPKDYSAILEQGNRCGKLDGIISYSNLQKAEKECYVGYNDRSCGYTHCLIVTFKDIKSMKYYMDHSEHTQFAKLVKPFATKPVAVIDMWQYNYPEFALYGHTMASKPGPPSKEPGGWVHK